MIGIDQAASVLGLTPRQVYRRISAARPVLSEYLRRGENNALLLDGSAIEILRAIEDYRKTGLTVTEAVGRILEEISGKQEKTSKENVEKGESVEGNGAAEPWRMLMAEKDKRISDLEKTISMLEKDRDHWRDLALDYQRQLAPPRDVAKGRHWWWPFRSVRSAN